MISYLITGVACICAGCCYAELCVELPIAGSAFIYTMVTFGELPAYITMGMILELYILAMAAISRSFSTYLALLCNLPASQFVVTVSSGLEIDYMAFGIVLLFTLLLCFSTRESKNLVRYATIAKLLLFFIICLVGYVKTQGTFGQDFTLPDKGADGVFQAASIIMFAFIGFDAITNAVEEVRTRVE